MERTGARSFHDHAYDPPAFGPARWLPDGTGLHHRRASRRRGAVGHRALRRRHRRAHGARRRRAAAAGRAARPPLAIDDYAWSADGTRLLLFTNTRKVWRAATRAATTGCSTCAAAGCASSAATRRPSSLMFAKFSPDGTRVGLRARQQPLRRARSTTGAITRLTSDGSDTIDQRHVRLGLRGGARRARRLPLEPRRHAASPTGSSTRPASASSRCINNTDSLYPVVTRIPYPEGRAPRTPRCASASSPPTAATTRWMKTPGDPRDSYLARLEWRGRATRWRFSN